MAEQLIATYFNRDGEVVLVSVNPPQIPAKDDFISIAGLTKLVSGRVVERSWVYAPDNPVRVAIHIK